MLNFWGVYIHISKKSRPFDTGMAEASELSSRGSGSPQVLLSFGSRGGNGEELPPTESIYL